MTESIWQSLLAACGEDFELCDYDRRNIMSNNACWWLILDKKYRAAIELWMN
jgi:hypothetical protein